MHVMYWHLETKPIFTLLRRKKHCCVDWIYIYLWFLHLFSQVQFNQALGEVTIKKSELMTLGYTCSEAAKCLKCSDEAELLPWTFSSSPFSPVVSRHLFFFYFLFSSSLISNRDMKQWYSQTRQQTKADRKTGQMVLILLSEETDLYIAYIWMQKSS